MALMLPRAAPAAIARRLSSARAPCPRPLQHKRVYHVPKADIAETGGLGSGRDLVAEFVGCALFQIIGGCAPAQYAPAANGLGLTMLIYAVGNASGAHLNPAVTLMLLLTKQIQGTKAICYMLAQVAGCVAGALLCTFLVPGVTAGMGLGAPGTFAPAAGLAMSAVFMWECLLTFMLGAVVYGAVIAKPGFGTSAPLGIGLAVMCGAMAAGGLTGCIMNPARALGPAIVYGLQSSTVMVYVAAQMTGGALAAVLARLFYGMETADTAMAQAAVVDQGE